MKEARSYRTKQREMVLQFFSAHPGKCFCAKELIAQKSIPVGSATLYRTLALLCQEGKLKKYTDVSGNSAFYQYNESDSCHYHFHLKCLRCGRPMEFVMRENIQLGKTGWVTGDWDNLLAGGLDVAFFPVDPRMGSEIEAGAAEFARRFAPRLLIPMHFGENFAAMQAACRTGLAGQRIWAPTRRGDTVLLE